MDGHFKEGLDARIEIYMRDHMLGLRVSSETTCLVDTYIRAYICLVGIYIRAYMRG